MVLENCPQDNAANHYDDSQISPRADVVGVVLPWRGDSVKSSVNRGEAFHPARILRGGGAGSVWDFSLRWIQSAGEPFGVGNSCAIQGVYLGSIRGSFF
jgi:hypothetical protein